MDKRLCNCFELFFPRRCICCGRQLLDFEQYLCIYCEADFPYTRFQAEPLNGMTVSLGTRASALMRYSHEEGYGEVCRSLKYRGDIPCGRHFAAMLGRSLRQAGWAGRIDCVVPVPLHWTRRWKRGYNQAEVIGRQVAGVLGVPLVTGLLGRRRRTGTQTRLSAGQRGENTSGAFRVDRHRYSKLCSEAGGRLRILLVDDVFTTGATLKACMAAFKPSEDGTGAPAPEFLCATLGYSGSL